MDELTHIPEIQTANFDLKSYINKKHPAFNLSVFKTSLARLQHIKKQTDIKTIKLFDTSSMNFDIIDSIDKLSLKLKQKISFSEEKKTDKSQFFSELSIKKFKTCLDKFQENLEVFITENRILEFECTDILIHKTKRNDEIQENFDFKENDFFEGILILTNDILFIGKADVNGYLLVDSFSFDVIEKNIFEKEIKMKKTKNNQNSEETNSENIKDVKESRLFLSLKSPSFIFYFLMNEDETLKCVSTFEKCVYKKTKPSKNQKEYKKYKKIEFLLETEQYDALQKIIKKNKNKEILNAEKKIMSPLFLNKQFLSKKEENEDSNKIIKKIVKSLNYQKNTFKDLFILLQIVDPVVYLYSVYKQFFPSYVVENFIDKYFKYYHQFLDESENILKEIRKKDSKIEIVEIILLLKEKITQFTLRKCMKQVLWRGRRTDEVDILLKELEEKIDLKYLLNNYAHKIEKWKKNRKKFGMHKLQELSEKIEKK